MRSMSLQRVSKSLLVIGLLGLILILINRKGMSIYNKTVLLFSKYRSLMPYVVAHAQVESDNFTSTVYKTDHNMFGMKWVGQRNTTQGIKATDGGHYAHYNSDTDSLLGLIVWFDLNRFPVSVKSSEEYASELKKRNYYGGDVALYTKNLNYWLTKKG